MYEIYEKLLLMNGVTSADVSKATGIRESTLSTWKKRRNMLGMKNAKLIADYFGVSVDFLLHGYDVQNNGQQDSYYLNEDARDLAQFLMENPAYKELFDASRKVKASDIAIVKQLLDRFGGNEES